MFNLLRSMAITNLPKNCALYVPFALETVQRLPSRCIVRLSNSSGGNVSVTLNATLVIGAIFAVVYFIVYQITSRSYYGIIKR